MKTGALVLAVGVLLAPTVTSASTLAARKTAFARCAAREFHYWLNDYWKPQGLDCGSCDAGNLFALEACASILTPAEIKCATENDSPADPFRCEPDADRRPDVDPGIIVP